MSEKNKLPPMTLSDNETGEVFTLEFSRESVRFAESRGFSISDVSDFPMTKVPDLFFYAFRKNHMRISKSRTDKILFEDLEGLTREQIERLVQLYSAPMDALLRDDEDDGGAGPKNVKMTVEL